MCDQAKAVLIQNCYLAVSLGLQPKKSPDECAAQGVGQTRQGRLYMLDGGMICLPDPDTLLKVGKTRHLAYPTLFRMQWKTILKDHVKELFHSSPPKWRTLCHCVSRLNGQRPHPTLFMGGYSSRENSIENIDIQHISLDPKDF